MARGDYNSKEIAQMIDDCQNRESQLNDWERSFLSTCGNMSDKNIMLSQPQLENLNRIWERVTANG